MPLAEIHVTLKPSLFDAQGQTVLKALHQLGHQSVQNARIGKYITLEIEDADSATLQGQLDLMCQQLLANPVIEDYEITLSGFGDAAPVAPTGAPTNAPVAPNTAPQMTSRAATAGASATVAPGGEPLATAGGLAISDPFSLDYDSYVSMTTEAKLALRSLALQKYGAWINQQIQDRHAEWILCVGQNVVEAGDSLDTYPGEAQLQKLGADTELVPWVFIKPPQ